MHTMKASNMPPPPRAWYATSRPGEPVHQVLARLLRGRIDDGSWRPGGRVPSVRDLAAEFGVSSVTVSRALRQLVDAGLVLTFQGKGAYVIERAAPRERTTSGDYHWQTAVLPASGTARLATLVPPGDTPPDTISLASGGVASDIRPAGSARTAWRHLLQHGASSLLQAGVEQPLLLQGRSPAGEAPVRAWMAAYLEGAGIRADASQVLVTAGAQQALNLVVQTLLRPGDTILIERPTYVFALAVFEAMGLTCIEAPTDDHGLMVGAVADLMARHRPRLLFTVPTGHAPTGATMPLDRRQALLHAARQHQVVILEEDHAREFSHDEPAPPAIKSLDTDGHVVYARSFGKITLPALRIGCLVAHGPLFAALVETKRVADRYTSTLTQDAFLTHVSGPAFAAHIDQGRLVYRQRRDAMLAALQHEMPADARWIAPAVGFNIWLTLPPGLSARAVARAAAATGVLVLPSGPFYYRHDPDNAIRLTFSDNEAGRLAEAIRRLAAVIRSLAAPTDRRRGAAEFDMVVA
jgi:DNA-binding transcriptional MocR family regulator